MKYTDRLRQYMVGTTQRYLSYNWYARCTCTQQQEQQQYAEVWAAAIHIVCFLVVFFSRIGFCYMEDWKKKAADLFAILINLSQFSSISINFFLWIRFLWASADFSLSIGRTEVLLLYVFMHLLSIMRCVISNFFFALHAWTVCSIVVATLFMAIQKNSGTFFAHFEKRNYFWTCNWKSSNWIAINAPFFYFAQTVKLFAWF